MVGQLGSGSTLKDREFGATLFRKPRAEDACALARLRTDGASRGSPPGFFTPTGNR